MFLQRKFFKFSKKLLLQIILCHEYHNFVLLTKTSLRSMSQNVVCPHILNWDKHQRLNLMRLSRFELISLNQTYAILIVVNKRFEVAQMFVAFKFFNFMICLCLLNWSKILLS